MIEFIGRSCCCSYRVGIFEKYLDGCRDYIEIGSLFGGSAVAVGQIVTGEVHCVDPMNGYRFEGEPDPNVGIVPSPQIIRANWENAGLDPARLHLHPQKTPPLPARLNAREFDAAYIDGDHSFDAVMMDWILLHNRIRNVIIFDDIGIKAGPRKVVDILADHASDEWKLVHNEVMGVFRRV